MAYVDLNPIRAKMASSVEESEYTSVFERIHNKTHYDDKQEKTGCKLLVKFVGAEQPNQPQRINFTLIDYLDPVDWSGWIIREGKRGAISAQTPVLLSTLGLDHETWLSLASDFGKT
ncbi:MAG: hypothetical protein GY787_08435 [Alteromonadales bacterium]|nr:hypothetical protein [Alteromonadales bacterium]